MKQPSTKFDIARYVSPEMLVRLRILGKYKWIERTGRTITPDGRGSTFTYPPVPPEASELVRIYRSVYTLDGMLDLFVKSRAVAGGLKIVAPSREQCEAMEHTDANIPFSDFKSPYASMVFAWPNDWRPFGHGLDVTWMGEMRDSTFFSTRLDGDRIVTGLLAHDQFPTIEQAIRNSREEGSHISATNAIERVAINLCLLMTIHRWTQRPMDRPGERKAKKLMRSRKRRVREAGQRMLESLPRQFLLSFDQDIKLVDRVECDESDGKGKPKRPHWRRGYFKRQAYGPGWSKHRTIYIPPVMVNAGRFQGDVADTKVTYRL